MFNSLLCLDATPRFLGLFDLSVAPPLIFYAYIPIVLVSLFLSGYVSIKDKFSLRSSLLLTISVSFSLWVLNIIFQWIAVHATIMHFSWEMTAMIEIFIPISTIYFVSVFFRNGEDVSNKIKFIFSAMILPVAILLPTRLNMISFDASGYCGSIIGPLTYYVYAVEILAVFWIIAIGIKKHLESRREKIGDKESLKMLIISFGASIFLLIFSVVNIFGEMTKFYEVNLLGPIGMVLFISLLSYLIVKFKTFNIKLIATQALMFALIAIIGSQLFFVKTTINLILTGITLAMSVIFGGFLIRSVQKEVKQREEIEHLADSLAKSNDKLYGANEKLKELDRQKTEFVSIASHQLRSPLTAIKGYSSMLLEGSFGPVEDKAREAIDRIFESSQKLVNVIEDFLNITRIELGRMKYEISTFDLNKLIETVVTDQRPNIEKKGLVISFESSPDDYQISADSGKVTQVISNIIDNSIKYTPVQTNKDGVSGSWIKVKTERVKKMVRLTIADNGVGIEPATLEKLFNKFVRADDAGKANITGTGLGLYVAKQIVEGLSGKIWAESEGKGKGAQFIVEFPHTNGKVTKIKSKVEAYTKAGAVKAKRKEKTTTTNQNLKQ